MAIVEALIEVETSNAEALETFAAAGESFDVGQSQIMNVLPTVKGVHLRPWAKAIPMFTRSGAERADDLDGLIALSVPVESPDLTSVSHVVATEVEEDALSEIAQLPGVRVWPNSPITYFVDCPPFQPAVDVATIRDLLGVGPLHAAGITGSGVVAAVLDQGIDGTVYPVVGGYNRAGGQQPGAAPIISHGSMVAADIAVAAPDAKLLDFPFLTLLSSGAMAMLAAVLDQRRRDGTPHLVSNSWGFSGYPTQAQMPTHEVWDIDHPLNRKVLEVVAAGIPVVFSSGNCGAPCPSGNCNASNVGPGVSISGANALAEVITVAAVNATGDRIGYSSQGPGMFAHDKPDVASYSHFFGNFGPGRPGGTTAMPFDNGTSAACPVVSGVVALLLQARPGLAPSAVRSALIQGAGGGLWNPDTGHGIVNAAASHQTVTP